MLEHKIDEIDFMLQHLVKTVSLPHEIGIVLMDFAKRLYRARI